MLARDYIISRLEIPNPIQYELCHKETIHFDCTNDVICVLEYYVI